MKSAKAKPAAYGIILRNSSPNLVYDVEVVAKSKYTVTYAPLKLTCLPPGTHWAAWDSNSKDWAFPVDSSVVPHELRPVAMSGKLGIQLLRFRDAGDGVWSREEQGALAVHA